MLDKNVIDNLKQVDISKDKEKIKVRVREIWKKLDKNKRQEVFDLSGLTRYTVERTYKKGNISAKLIAAMSQLLKINPHYLTGESDDKNNYSDELLLEFVSNKRTMKPAPKSTQKSEQKTSQKPPVIKAVPAPAKEKPVLVQVEANKANEVKISTPSSMNITPPPKDEVEKLEKMSEEEILTLVKGLLLRSKFSNEANNLANMVKYLLTK